MVFDSHAVHHLQKRKRVYQKLEKYPSIDKKKNLVDKLIYIVIFIAPIMTIPQIIKIWVEKNASGLSIISWTTYALGSMLWLSYGFLHKEKPLIISHTIWTILHIMIIVGIIFYG
jgi:uncharacterized protein with PQ loop repeat